MLLASLIWVFPTPVHAQVYDFNQPEVVNQTETKTEQVTPPTNVQSIQEEKRETVLRPVQKTARSRDTISSSKNKPITTNQNSTNQASRRDYSKEEVQNLIIQYSQQYGISADLPLRVANCESGFNEISANKTSSARGVFQYLSSTWKNTEAGRAGLSVMDADANVHMAIKSIASGGISNWSASKSCWSK